MKEQNGFIATTAEDYALPYEVVEQVYLDSSAESFYDNLEELILSE